jgi:SAM-dependent methyltransferase
MTRSPRSSPARTSSSSPGAFDGLGGAVYDFYIERPALARIEGVLVWGLDSRRMYGWMAKLRDAPAGAAVLDVPCGGGVAFRYVRPGWRGRYVAADIAPGMLRRARREAERRELTVELVAADMQKLPFADRSFDVCASFSGLHHLPEPERAVEELVRCLKPGGRLIGCTFVTGTGGRGERSVRLSKRAGVMGNVFTAAELEDWLTDLEDVTVDLTGPLALFEAARAPAPTRPRGRSARPRS